MFTCIRVHGEGLRTGPAFSEVSSLKINAALADPSARGAGGALRRGDRMLRGDEQRLHLPQPGQRPAALLPRFHVRRTAAPRMILHHGPAMPHRRIVGLLLCAMLLMQLLGLLHGVFHAAGPQQAVHEGAAAPPDRSGLESLFVHHDSAADCQVFDQLSHGNAPVFARLDLDVEHPALPRLRTRSLPPVVAAPSGVPARGPPALA